MEHDATSAARHRITSDITANTRRDVVALRFTTPAPRDIPVSAHMFIAVCSLRMHQHLPLVYRSQVGYIMFIGLASPTLRTKHRIHRLQRTYPTSTKNVFADWA